jgi:signal transduction histidine kinase
VRTRLLTILLALMAAALVALGFPLARSIAQSRQQVMFFDRLGDTARFAGLAGMAAPAPGSDDILRAELERYDQVYGIPAAVVDRGEVRTASRPGFRIDDPDIQAQLDGALRGGGRRAEDPAPIWPWEHRPLVIVEPVLSGGDVVGAALTVSPTGRLRSQVLRWWLILGVGELTALLACVVVAIRLTRWVLRPVRDLDAVTHEIATGRLSARVPAHAGPPELRRLTGAFNEMADHVEDAISQQQAFVADASHQLRNPLSALLLRIENIGLGLPPEWLDELEETRIEGRRLAQVLDELLALARAEHHSGRLEIVDVPALVRERVAAWRPVGDTRGITLRRTGGTDPVTAFADRTSLGSALDAVLDNALKFSPPDSTVQAAVDVDGDRVRIRVTDEGPGVAPEELSKVGRRFWRSKQNVNIDGSGLGLSIAAALLAASGGDISFAAGEPGGLVVTLRVPTPPSPGAGRPPLVAAGASGEG